MLLSYRKLACTAAVSAVAAAFAGGVLAGAAYATPGSAPAVGPATASVQQFTNGLTAHLRASRSEMLQGAATPADWHWN
ncbi:hypothetical protein ACFXPX_34955 [Kitasatospora sp. NPDC059146]|uniref:hypothetical protein n=1 Tax=unclassified Kitasatospora TaxID=2633591 RepID=UPI0035E12B55